MPFFIAPSGFEHWDSAVCWTPGPLPQLGLLLYWKQAAYSIEGKQSRTPSRLSRVIWNVFTKLGFQKLISSWHISVTEKAVKKMIEIWV